VFPSPLLDRTLPYTGVDRSSSPIGDLEAFERAVVEASAPRRRDIGLTMSRLTDLRRHGKR
jgi:hypothetical protein